MKTMASIPGVTVMPWHLRLWLHFTSRLLFLMDGNPLGRNSFEGVIIIFTDTLVRLATVISS